MEQTDSELNILQAQPLPPKDLKVSDVFIVDSAYAIHEQYILKEFLSYNMNVKHVFNYRLYVDMWSVPSVY